MNEPQFPFVLPSTVTGLILAVWWLFFITGRAQLRRIERRTEALVLEQVEIAQRSNAGLTLEEFYTSLIPEWQKMVRASAWFVTHKTELFPIPARPELVLKRLDMDDVYIGRILVAHDIELKGHGFRKVKKEFSKAMRKVKNA